jgi:hypothetical protein
MPYVFVRKTVRCPAPALDVLTALRRSSDRFTVGFHAARFQIDYPEGRLRSFVIGNTTAQATGCEVVLKFYVSRALAKLLLLSAALLAASLALHLGLVAFLAAATLAVLATRSILDLRALSSFFHGLLEP